MALSFDTTSHGTSGVKTMTVGFQPLEATLEARPSPGTAFTSYVRKSHGFTDGTNQIGEATTCSTSRVYQQCFADRMLTVWEWNGAAWAETMKVTFDSFTATEFKYNVVTPNSNFQIARIVRG